MVENKENYLKYMNHKKESMQEAFQDTSQSGTGNEALTMFCHELLSPFLTVLTLATFPFQPHCQKCFLLTIQYFDLCSLKKHLRREDQIWTLINQKNVWSIEKEYLFHQHANFYMC